MFGANSFVLFCFIRETKEEAKLETLLTHFCGFLETAEGDSVVMFPQKDRFHRVDTKVDFFYFAKYEINTKL
jgi:hypothetical protein